MDSYLERSIVRNIFTLTTETINVSQLADDLAENGGFSCQEREQILSCNDEKTQCNLLYEMILRKPSASFDFLIKGLRRTRNDPLASLLEESLVPPTMKSKPRKISQLTKRVSCSDFYEDVLGNKQIAGREMGIAEILEENPFLKKNWQMLAKILGINDGLESCEIYADFTVKATLILRRWVQHQKRQATLKNLTASLRAAKHFTCAARIRKMFERADKLEEKWGFDDHQRPATSVTGKEQKVALILDDNPSFCLHIERLFLMLNIHMELYKVYTAQFNFLKNATGILRVWKEMNDKEGTVQNLVILLARNGHPFTAETTAAYTSYMLNVQRKFGVGGT